MKVTPSWDVSTEAARAVDLSYECYETLLELQSVLAGYEDLPEPPRWAFGVLRAVGRALGLADTAHCAALRVRGVYADVKPAIEARDE